MTVSPAFPAADPGRSALAKASWRLLPLLGLGYCIAYMDRINISFAALEMNEDLHFSATIYGLGAGLFSLSYCLLEVPSNLLLARFGARRWISRIMLTWGVIAVGMMFVRTPFQFYVMRFLLGMAEAGFFPGVLFYLKHWFPAEHSGRAISRFYIAVPLGAAFMGAISGTLLNLRGVAGLSGWQWLFFAEGMPAIVLSFIIFFCLPDDPLHASWLTAEERDWISSRLSSDDRGLAPVNTSRLGEILRDPLIWKLGLCNFLILGSNYAFSLSAPTLLKGATHWSSTTIGFLMSGTALAGVAAMLFNGWHSDRHSERHRHVAVPLTVMAAALAAIAVTSSPAVIVTAFFLYYSATYAVQAAFWPIPSDLLRGRSAAVGLAAVGSIGMLGGFVGPYSWGIAKDHTGDYRVGLLTLCVIYLVAAGLVLVVRPALSPGVETGR